MLTALRKASNGICGIRRGHERGIQLDTSGPERRSGGLRRAGAAVPEAGVRPCGADVPHAGAGGGGGTLHPRLYARRVDREASGYAHAEHPPAHVSAG